MFAVPLLLLLAVATPQGQESRPVPRDSVEVEARGCLKGRVFTATAPPAEEGVRRGPDVTGRHFRVAGPRAVMSEVKKYNGQMVEVVGIVRRASLDDQGMGMRVGGARVIIGAPSGDPSRMNARTSVPTVATMDLVVVRYLAERCPLQ